jgi:hypothetical protein
MATYSVGDIVVVLSLKRNFTPDTPGRIGKIRQVSTHKKPMLMVRFGFEDFIWVYKEGVRLATDKEALAWRLTK